MSEVLLLLALKRSVNVPCVFLRIRQETLDYRSVCR
jgi:hypothetical protein